MASLKTGMSYSKHWSLGLVESMKDPANIIKKTDRVIVIQDMYPKAKIHFLVLPQENINSIDKLNRSHISLLEEFGKLYEELKIEYKEHALRAGFHAVPSMQRLHMHIISKDMISPRLKTRGHWNSFTTKYFVPYEDVLNELKEKGSLKFSKEEYKSLLAMPLKCNQCNFIPVNMPNLKEHLLTHDTNN